MTESNKITRLLRKAEIENEVDEKSLRKKLRLAELKIKELEKRLEIFELPSRNKHKTVKFQNYLDRKRILVSHYEVCYYKTNTNFGVFR